MKGLMAAVIAVIGLLNATFIGVVGAEVATSPLMGGVAALVTLGIEVVLSRKIRQAMAASAAAAQLPDRGHL